MDQDPPVPAPREKDVLLGNGRIIQVRSWAALAAARNFGSVLRWLQQLAKGGLLDMNLETIQLADLLSKLDPDALFGEATTKVLGQMISDATLNDLGTPLLTSEETLALDQFDFEDLARAAWEINVRPRLGLLSQRRNLSGPAGASLSN